MLLSRTRQAPQIPLGGDPFQMYVPPIPQYAHEYFVTTLDPAPPSYNFTSSISIVYNNITGDVDQLMVNVINIEDNHLSLITSLFIRLVMFLPLEKKIVLH